MERIRYSRKDFIRMALAAVAAGAGLALVDAATGNSVRDTARALLAPDNYLTPEKLRIYGDVENTTKLVTAEYSILDPYTGEYINSSLLYRAQVESVPFGASGLLACSFDARFLRPHGHLAVTIGYDNNQEDISYFPDINLDKYPGDMPTLYFGPEVSATRQYDNYIPLKWSNEISDVRSIMLTLNPNGKFFDPNQKQDYLLYMLKMPEDPFIEPESKA